MQNSPQPNNRRIESLDWLRGSMAIAVMFYHLTLWLYSPLDASSLLGRLGIYAVSVFFVLSGLSMVIVYHSFFSSWRQILIFWIRRVVRIWPLLWFSILLVLFHPNFNFETLDVENVLSTATTAFAIIHPAKYFLIGAWSIGNEMLYYLLTPLIFLVYAYRKSFGDLLFTCSALIALYFSFQRLDPEISLAKQWADYVNPWNNLFFYVSGVWMYFSFRKVQVSTVVTWSIFLLSLGVLLAMPSYGNQICLVTDWNRIVYSIFAVALVFTFYKNSVQLPRLFQKLFQILGESTYGIYLLHPIVYSYVGLIAKKMGLFSSPFLFFSTSVITIILAYGSFVFIEKPMIKLGKKWTN